MALDYSSGSPVARRRPLLPLIAGIGGVLLVLAVTVVVVVRHLEAVDADRHAAMVREEMRTAKDLRDSEAESARIQKEAMDRLAREHAKIQAELDAARAPHYGPSSP